MASEILQLLQERTLPVRQQLQLHWVRGQTQWDPQPNVDKQRALSVEPDHSTKATAAVTCPVTITGSKMQNGPQWNKLWILQAQKKRSLSVFFHLSINAPICCTVHAWSDHLCLQFSVKLTFLYFFLTMLEHIWTRWAIYCILDLGTRPNWFAQLHFVMVTMEPARF